ncbi:MAG: hypothetical protein AAFW98_06840 [Pseudomonadota bacterium]
MGHRIVRAACLDDAGAGPLQPAIQRLRERHRQAQRLVWTELMVGFLKRAAAPVIRLTTVQHVEYEATFRAFAQNVGQVVVEKRAQEEPRVVSFPMRAFR